MGSINYIKTERYYFMSENSKFILLRIIILLPFSIIGGIMISYNNIRTNKNIFIWFLRNIWFLPISFNVSRNLFFLSSASYINKIIDFISFIYLFQVIEVFLLYLLIIFIFY